MRKSKRIGSKLYLGMMLLFFYAPIIYLILFSFNSSRSLTHFEGFSLQWYERVFQNRDIREAIMYTIVIAILATIISTIVGTITAIGLSKSKRIIREITIQINNFPVLNPDIVTAIGLMLLFVSWNIEKGFTTMLLAHIAFCIPYVMLSVMPKLRQLDSNLLEAALDLGATPIQAMTKVLVPQIMPGIISGALIAFSMSFDDFVISYFVTGNGVSNISILVYTMSKRINRTINAISTLVVVVITIVLLIINIIPMIKERKRGLQ